jgi:choline dehydrogenase
MAQGYDIAVVGGGAAGCVVASRLAATGDRSVVLIEAGPDLRSATPPDWHDGWTLPKPLDWEFESEPDATGATGKLRRGRVLGGTSWLTRFAVRGAAADFDAWAARGNPGWRYEDVLPAFRRLERDAEFGDDRWHGTSGPIPITRYPATGPSGIHAGALDALTAAGFATVADHNAPDAVGVGRIPMSSRDGRRSTTSDAYLPAGEDPPTLTIRADAPVASVQVEAGRATGVKLADGSVIHADQVVVCAGTYGSPAILMRSGIGPSAHLTDVGVDVVIDLPGVGSNLADHPAVDLDTGWRGPATTGPILHSIATLRTAGAAPDGPPDLMFWVSDPAGAEPGCWIDPILLKPLSRGWVRLRSADPLAAPRITLPSLTEPADVDRLIEGYRLGLELVGRRGIRKLATDPAPTSPTTPDGWRQRIAENAYSIPHVVGTCRMGPDPQDGDVVDALGRVHGVERLSVIDASIIPDAPAGFPHLITIMVAEHLSAAMSNAT